jgi:hypothetical protein
MPGWYVHMEAARLAAERLAAGDVPADLGLDPAEAQRLGALARTWRNYLAVGSLGPDLFYLLPDFKAPFGGPLLGVADWVLNAWDTVERLLIGPMDRWLGPVGANNSDLAAQLTGGLSRQIGMALEEVTAIILKVLPTAVTRSTDVFGRLTSGIPQGVGESAFFWSDICHYRRTYELPQAMYRLGRQKELTATSGDERLDGQAQQAFALGWMTHCAADVTGHAFTNAKSGGPFRLHWQRHHLVENHFDTRCYDARNGGQTHYQTIGTSALHFRIAFRVRGEQPYTGRADAPAYDYFNGFPAYALGDTGADDLARRQHFSMGPGVLPAHLAELITESLKEVYTPDVTPTGLLDAPAYTDAGRPNAAALQTMWKVAFRFLAANASSGFSLKTPPSPPLIGEHPFPTPPGGGPGTSPDRGVDLGAPDKLTVVDILLAVLAWMLFVAQVVIWLVTVLPGLILDVATFPAREVLYYTVVAPLHSMHMAARRMLVATGFLTPEPGEIDPGLVTLGRSSTFLRQSLLADLNDPAGFAGNASGTDEISGRASATSEWDLDPAYPRDTPRDPDPVLASRLAAAGVPPAVPKNGEQAPYSEWVAPWRYPERDISGNRLGWEADLTHAGPYVTGQDASVLLGRSPTDVEVAKAYEQADTPEATEELSAAMLPADRHLGNPVDYSLYLIARLTGRQSVPGFNLDSDRGYAWRCWDWSRHAPNGSWHCEPFGVPRFGVEQPCTPPAQMDPYWADDQQPLPAQVQPEHAFNPSQRRLVKYFPAGPASGECGVTDIKRADRDRAGVAPEGEG